VKTHDIIEALNFDQAIELLVIHLRSKGQVASNNQTTMQTKPRFTERKFIVTLIFVTSLFMLWGIAITMGDVLNRHFQNVLKVSKAQSGLVQFSIFGAYAIMGIPAGLFMKKFGYKNGVLLGLFLYLLPMHLHFYFSG
jgi:fucose permease